MATFPTDEQMETATLWLEGNEGEGDEGEACRAVAAWLKHERREREIRAAARRNKVPTALARRAFERLETTEGNQ